MLLLLSDSWTRPSNDQIQEETHSICPACSHRILRGTIAEILPTLSFVFGRALKVVWDVHSTSTKCEAWRPYTLRCFIRANRRIIIQYLTVCRSLLTKVNERKKGIQRSRGLLLMVESKAAAEKELINVSLLFWAIANGLLQTEPMMYLISMDYICSFRWMLLSRSCGCCGPSD